MVKSQGEKAWSAKDLQALFRVHELTIKRWTKWGWISRPQMTYPLTGKEYDMTKIFGHAKKGFWHRHQIEELCDHMQYTKAKNRIPTRREINAMDKYDLILYAKTTEGDFIPVWEAEDW